MPLAISQAVDTFNPLSALNPHLNRMPTPQPVPPSEAPAIEDYAAIGDCRSLALVSRLGSVDWLCVPRFSAPSLFGALLDAERGGRFSLRLSDLLDTRQHYIEGTNVLVTELRGATGRVRITDFMAMPDSTPPPEQTAFAQCLVRIVECTEGHVDLEVACAPRPGYASLPVRWRRCERHDRRWHLDWPDDGHATFDTDLAGLEARDGTLAGAVALRMGDTRRLLLSFTTPGRAPAIDRVDALRQDTEAWWQRWSGQCRYEGPHRPQVLRSALTLKLLTYAPTGAVIAAGTTSLPESCTGERNWDYRYCWLRDTSLVLQAFMDLGYLHESQAFLKWLLHAASQTQPHLHVLYDEEGQACPPEHIAEGLSGYHGIGPVRVGNAAVTQRQMDIYGEVIVTATTFAERGGELSDRERHLLCALADTVCELWRQPDAGIWEIRASPRHNTHSKVMCWVALDRILRLHARIGLAIDADRIAREREAIRADIEANGLSAATGGYVGVYGGRHPDASLLLLPRFGYVDARDERMVRTVAHIQSELSHQGLLYRYPPGGDYDGVSGQEQLFVICSFWLVDCLARQGRREEAGALFDRLLGLRTPAGLYAEELDAQRLQPMGNLPQAFSHVGLITAALALHRFQERETPSPSDSPPVK